MNIKPIETYFNGTLFRSRLEARWAVFFKELGIEYRYESEGYDVGNRIWYLPDFYIPHIDEFIEIKGEKISEPDIAKVKGLANLTMKKCYVFEGEFPNPETVDECGYETGQDGVYESAWVFFPMQGEDYRYAWCECSHCGRLEIHYCGRSDRIGCDCPYDSCNEDKAYNANSKRLLDAYYKAKNYKFLTRKQVESIR